MKNVNVMFPLGTSGGSGGQVAILQDKEVEITANGKQTIVPDEGYTGLHKVDLNVNTPTWGGDIPEYDITDPVQLYKYTRPKDWLPMPKDEDMNDKEIYLLAQVNPNGEGFYAFSSYCSNGKLEMGTMDENGLFVPDDSKTQILPSYSTSEVTKLVISGKDWGNLTVDGLVQCMIKISVSSHTNFSTERMWESNRPNKSYCIVEIKMKSSTIDNFQIGNPYSTSMSNFRYFSFVSPSSLRNIRDAFRNCERLEAIQMDLSTISNTATYSFAGCKKLISILNLSTKAEEPYGFSSCYDLRRLTFAPTEEAVSGKNVDIRYCYLDYNALLELFNSLPSVTASPTLTVTGNPGVSELTDEEKAIATDKGWTLAV